jgi:hypothetical protein
MDTLNSLLKPFMIDPSIIEATLLANGWINNGEKSLKSSYSNSRVDLGPDYAIIRVDDDDIELIKGVFPKYSYSVFCDCDPRDNQAVIEYQEMILAKGLLPLSFIDINFDQKYNWDSDKLMVLLGIVVFDGIAVYYYKGDATFLNRSIAKILPELSDCFGDLEEIEISLPYHSLAALIASKIGLLCVPSRSKSARS